MGQRKRLDLSLGDNSNLTTEYTKLFNREVREFFNLEGFVDYEIRGSRVHTLSEVRYLEKKSNLAKIVALDENYTNTDDVVEVTMGSYWSGAEKRKFFKLLERYSIHRLDHWHHLLRRKSKLEIINYYMILKRNLQWLKNGRSKRLHKRIDLPIAYEVDDDYIKLEEIMSHRMSKEYEKSSTRLSDDGRLVDMENWNKRWSLIYRKSNIEEIQPVNKEAIEFSTEGSKYIDKCIKNYLRKLLWYSILPNLECRSIGKFELLKEYNTEMEPEDSDVINIKLQENGPFYPHLVTKEAIEKAIGLMKQNGNFAPTLGETVINMINKYEISYKPADGNLFKRKQITESILPKIISKSLMYDIKQDKPAMKQEQSNSKLIQTTEESFMRKLQRLNESINGKTKTKSTITFIADKNGNANIEESLRLDNDVELDLIDWETQLMETHDINQSKLHQMTLLTYFQSLQSDSNKKKDNLNPIPISSYQSRINLQGKQQECPITIPMTLQDWFMRCDG